MDVKRDYKTAIRLVKINAQSTMSQVKKPHDTAVFWLSGEKNAVLSQVKCRIKEHFD